MKQPHIHCLTNRKKLSLVRRSAWFSLLLLAILLTSFSPSTGNAFDHNYSAYDKVLKAAIQPDGVKYSAVAQHRKSLQTFLDQTSQLTSAEYNSWSRDQQLAMWINLYNGLILKTIIDRKPNQLRPLLGVVLQASPTSIWHIKKVWDTPHQSVAGFEITLRKLENDIIREKFDEPLIHFGLNCASIGCPPLIGSPYKAETLRQQLLASTHSYLQDSERGLRWDSKKRVLHLSKIFKWYHDDYKPSTLDGAIPALPQSKETDQKKIQFILQHVDKKTASEIVQGPVKIQYLFYDWDLNNS